VPYGADSGSNLASYPIRVGGGSSLNYSFT